MSTVDLNNYRTSVGTGSSRVFSGRERGVYVREQSKIDELFPVADRIQVIIPDDVFSITPSFLEALFCNIVLKHGKESILKKVDFVGKYKIRNAFDEALDRILMRNTGLVG